jgi:lysylphosphatidylglycerol synthetase-like protein (DUF2156 family)
MSPKFSLTSHSQQTPTLSTALSALLDLVPIRENVMATEKEPVAKVMPVQTGTTEVQKTKFDFRSLNTLSVVSLASALTGIGALMAIITGHIAQAQIKRSGENGRVLAVVGTVLGYVSIVSWIVVSILSVFFVALISEGMTGFQPGMFELHEFRRGFGDQ